MIFNTLRRSTLAAALAVTLAGCGVSTYQPAMRAPAGLRAASALEEPVPSAEELKALAEASPDRLIDNAPPEPGMQAEGLWPHPPAGDLGNFGKVNEKLWRGARPTDKGLEKLQAMGVKTIVNFENSRKVVEHERAWAEAHGIRFVSIPLSVILPPKRANVEAFLKLANDEASLPLYFHCMQGRDRTGVAAFTYRVSHDGWDYDKAYAEMKSYKFHTYLLGLRYFLCQFAKRPDKAKELAELAPVL